MHKGFKYLIIFSVMKNKENKTCEGCDAMCCKYVALEIDCPEELEDFENIKWYVCHKNINVFVEEDDVWNIEFITPCAFLDKNGWCKIYNKRPQLCKDYSQEQCLFHNSDYNEKYRFERIEDVEKYIEEVFKKGSHLIPEDEEEEEKEDLKTS